LSRCEAHQGTRRHERPHTSLYPSGNRRQYRPHRSRGGPRQPVWTVTRTQKYLISAEIRTTIYAMLQNALSSTRHFQSRQHRLLWQPLSSIFEQMKAPDLTNKKGQGHFGTTVWKHDTVFYVTSVCSQCTLRQGVQGTNGVRSQSTAQTLWAFLISLQPVSCQHTRTAYIKQPKKTL